MTPQRILWTICFQMKKKIRVKAVGCVPFLGKLAGGEDRDIRAGSPLLAEHCFQTLLCLV